MHDSLANFQRASKSISCFYPFGNATKNDSHRGNYFHGDCFGLKAFVRLTEPLIANDNTAERKVRSSIQTPDRSSFES